ncbi:hypothetical protein PG993_005449 [Apiospora rasikravindrae]|uniref:Uncharacterized protein n=1 Tax=Apiospora rasikravindrae TaxID=990691 RepID=A0ABR1THJ1_9PEZI
MLEILPDQPSVQTKSSAPSDRVTMKMCTKCGGRLGVEGGPRCRECRMKSRLSYMRVTGGLASEYSCSGCHLGLKYKNTAFCKACAEEADEDCKTERQALIELGIGAACGFANMDECCRSPKFALSESAEKGTARVAEWHSHNKAPPVTAPQRQEPTAYHEQQDGEEDKGSERA